jgi:hypothetical protein
MSHASGRTVQQPKRRRLVLAFLLGVAIGGTVVDALWLTVKLPCAAETDAITPPFIEPENPTPRRDHGKRWDARRAWGASQEKTAVDHVVPPKGDAVC